jgi:cytoskeleton protein RodZ
MRRKQTLRLPLGKWFFWLVLSASVLILITYGVPFVERLKDKADQPAEDGGSLVLPLDAPSLDPGASSLPEFSGRPEIEALPESESLADAVEQPVEESGQEPVSSSTGVTGSEQPPVPEIAITGPAEISMRFIEDSWVEMESHGRKLVVGTQRAGSQRTVRAEPPIQILLGNAPGVEISYRGKVVDLQSFQRGKVARLVLED